MTFAALALFAAAGATPDELVRAVGGACIFMAALLLAGGALVAPPVPQR